MEEILTKAFPDVFLYGKAYGSTNSLSYTQIRHLLCQFTNAAATNRALLYYLHDVMVRHSVIYNFANKVRADPQAFMKFAVMLTDEAFLKKIKVAYEEVNCDYPKPHQGVAKEVLRQVLPV